MLNVKFNLLIADGTSQKESIICVLLLLNLLNSLRKKIKILGKPSILSLSLTRLMNSLNMNTRVRSSIYTAIIRQCLILTNLQNYHWLLQSCALCRR